MSQTLSDLQEGLGAMVEAFTEVEDELESSVYAMFKPSLDKAQQSIMAVSTQLQNFAIVQELLKEVSEAPDIELNREIADNLLANFRHQKGVRFVEEERLMPQPAPRQRRGARIEVNPQANPMPGTFGWPPPTALPQHGEVMREQAIRTMREAAIRWDTEPQ